MTASGIDVVIGYLDAHQKEYIDRLAEVVAIKSVSAWPEFRPDVIKMVNWMKTKLEDCGAKCELRDIGQQTLPDKSQIPLPPILLGSLGEDPAKKTILLYGHLDVQPALKEDGWDTEPFVLTEKDGKLYGRGATDDKGPVLGWLHVIEAYKATKTPLPVNLKFCFEGMEESGSEGLDELLLSMKGGDFLNKVDHVCISDNYWLGTQKPCLTYGLRGLIYFGVEIECSDKDLHSGIFGGTVHEAMNDLMWVMSQLVDVNNKILIPGVMDDVAPITPEEQKLYEKIDFDLNEYQKTIGCEKLVHHGKKDECLQARWRNPSLSIHGVEGAFYGPGAKTVIPKKVVGKFSIRLVPNQDPTKIGKIVLDYLNELWKKRGSPNKFRPFIFSEGRSWVSDPFHPNFQAGSRATQKIYGVEPDFTREGGSIPVTLTFEEVTGKNVLLLPMGQADDGAHSQNEKISKRNYIEGTKLLAVYLDEVSKC
ncbi:cytosolic non-specific dipeptidase-like [Varroa jacobsoni]|uniref:Peptidase M20 dimerisation domain-containing protein n=1 Tax=Varroa destructor TaxID=109461 RepID=A0A7M7JAQ4_VARDE|nr:cytosolic non-specific dipeptidase-like [Varroa destructor]XP_022649270.1 cytosolic non-specific dipeptidase-like [Varroa destructor]XP_022702565.1 cytosolic non-specific dipeptidase-like [Varroa jacobsoni]